MTSLNSVTLLGNLGNTPEMKLIPNGKNVTTFRLATNESWRKSDGSLQTNTQWHRIVCWGKIAETCSQYLTKGRQVLIEGKISNRSYVAADGITRYVSEVIASSVRFLGGGKGAATAPDDVPPPSDEDVPAEPLSASDVTF